MTDRIEPALTPDQWARYWMEAEEMVRDTDATVQDYLAREYPNPAREIALANAALPDDDPRKITRADVHELAYMADQTDNDALLRIAAKLDALLPPE